MIHALAAVAIYLGSFFATDARLGLAMFVGGTAYILWRVSRWSGFGVTGRAR